MSYQSITKIIQPISKPNPNPNPKQQQDYYSRRRRSEKLYGSIRKNINQARQQISEHISQRSIDKISGITGIRSKTEEVCYSQNIQELTTVLRLNRNMKQGQSYYSKIKNTKNQKIMSVLMNKIHQQSSFKKTKQKPIISDQQIYEELTYRYISLIDNKLTQNDNQLLSLIDKICKCNNFFNKLNQMLALSFLKVGKIKLLQQKQYLYRQDDPSTSFYIILWGQFKLKQTHQRKTMYCFPGDTLCEQIIINTNTNTLNRKNKQIFGDIKLVCKIQPKLQNARALTHCGVLELERQDYQRIKKGFSQFGCKDQFYLADKMITWSYYKKLKLRK